MSATSAKALTDSVCFPAASEGAGEGHRGVRARGAGPGPPELAVARGKASGAGARHGISAVNLDPEGDADRHDSCTAFLQCLCPCICVGSRRCLRVDAFNQPTHRLTVAPDRPASAAGRCGGGGRCGTCTGAPPSTTGRPGAGRPPRRRSARALAPWKRSTHRSVFYPPAGPLYLSSSPLNTFLLIRAAQQAHAADASCLDACSRQHSQVQRRDGTWGHEGRLCRAGRRRDVHGRR